MSILPNQTNVNQNKYFFVEVDSKIITTSTITANSGLFLSIGTNNLSSGQITTSTLVGSNIIGYNNYLDYIQNINLITNVITLDGQGITASTNGIYLNGVLVALPGEISSIGFWAEYPASANINANNSTIKNAKGISTLGLSTGSLLADSLFANSGNIKTLVGSNLTYSNASLCNLNTSSLYVNDIVSEQIYNQFEISTATIRASVGVIDDLESEDIRTNNLFANNISSGTIEAYYLTTSSIVNYGDLASRRVLVNNLLAIPSGIALISTIQTNYLSSGSVSTNTLSGKDGIFSSLTVGKLFTDGISISSFTTNTISVSSIFASNISASELYVSSVVGIGGSFDTLYTNNIYNTSNITTSNLNSLGLITASNVDISGALVVDGSLTFNGGLVGNSGINFNTGSVPIYGTQYLYDIENVRNLTIQNINIQGGATGNLLPPFYYDSILNVGTNLTTPGQVTINGFNPDPLDTGIALDVDGDTRITQNLNVLGLTTLEGLVDVVGETNFQGDVNVQGLLTAEGDFDTVGIATITGATNCLGGLAVEGGLGVIGLANFTGAVTAQAGIGVVGTADIYGGDITFGNALSTNNTFTSWLDTTIKGNLTVDGTTTIGSVLTSTIFTENLFASTIGTNLTAYIGSGVSDGGMVWYSEDLLTQRAIIARNETVSTLYINSSNRLYLEADYIDLSGAVSFNNNNLINISTLGANFVSTNVFVANIGAVSSFIVESDSRIGSISTNNISSGVIYSKELYTESLGNPNPFIPTPINVNNGLNLQGNNIFNVRDLSTQNLFVSTIEADYLSSTTFTDSLFPKTANASLGYFGSLGSASGGFYNTLNTRSTITQTITPDRTGIYSNVIYNTGFLSSQSLRVSSINATTIILSTFLSTAFVQADNIGVRSNIVVNRIDGSFCQFSQFAGGILGVNFINSFTSNGVVFVSSNLSSANLRVSSITANNIFNAGFVSTATIQTSGTINVGPTGNGTVNAGQVNAPATGIVNLPNIQPVQSVNTCGRLTQTWGGGYFVSTFTNTLLPISGINDINSTVNVRGTLSTLNQTVSSINRKLYPFFSTLNVPASTFSINGTSANTPIVLYSNVAFPNTGLWKLSHKSILSKNPGGTSADLHGNILYTQGSFPSTFSLLDGYSALPTVNQDGVSSFTTLNTNVLISSITTRNISYYDATANNYTARLYMGNLVAEYVPPFGFGIDSGSNPAF